MRTPVSNTRVAVGWTKPHAKPASPTSSAQVHPPRHASCKLDFMWKNVIVLKGLSDDGALNHEEFVPGEMSYDWLWPLGD